MKHSKFLVISILMVFVLTGCGNKASSYYETVDEAISLYEEYLAYQESVENNVTTSDEENNQNRKIALMQHDAFSKIDDIKDVYVELSDTEKTNLENYILTEHDSKYGALVDWFKGTITTYVDLDKAIKEVNTSSQSNSYANHSDSIQLSSGNYNVPEDIPIGLYDVIYVSGIVPSVDIENNGNDDFYECFSENNESFSNLTLNDGAKIKIESGTVEFRKKN